MVQTRRSIFKILLNKKWPMKDSKLNKKCRNKNKRRNKCIKSICRINCIKRRRNYSNCKDLIPVNRGKKHFIMLNLNLKKLRSIGRRNKRGPKLCIIQLKIDFRKLLKDCSNRSSRKTKRGLSLSSLEIFIHKNRFFKESRLLNIFRLLTQKS